MKGVDEATYLGGVLTKTVSREAELNNRFTKAIITCNKLKIFWSKTGCSLKWKLQIYNAIVVA
eukprot:12142190-Karenia_brevis.AAC.1